MTGSTTKAFTAAAAALLVHDNENYRHVEWTSPINKFIREDFVLENKYATKHVTIEDALVHRTGLPRHDLVHGQPGDTVADVTRKLRYLPLTATPGRKYQYCPIMYGVVAHLLQTITGRNLAEQLEDRFWKPLGMQSTTFTKPDDTSHLARGYYWHEPEERYVPEYYDDITAISGSGDIYSTVNDYALWIKALLEASSSDSNLQNKSSPLSQGLVKDLLTPRMKEGEYTSDGEPIYYALGWEVTTFRDETIVAHGGGETGFGTYVIMLPGKQFGVVTMANTMMGGVMSGAILASQLLLQKLNLSDHAHETDFTAFVRKDGSQKSGNGQIRAKREEPTKTIPPPIPIADFTGSYSHPAYGAINLTIARDTNSDTDILEALFYPRTWPLKLQLAHANCATFDIRTFEPHGLGDVMTGEGIVWEDVSHDDDDDDNEDEDRWALFEFARDSKTIKKLGMEIEEEVVKMARKMGEKEWRKGMIWFEKVS